MSIIDSILNTPKKDLGVINIAKWYGCAYTYKATLYYYKSGIKLTISKSSVDGLAKQWHSIFLKNTAHIITIIEEAIDIMEHKIPIDNVDNKSKQTSYFDNKHLDPIVKQFQTIKSPHLFYNNKVTSIITSKHKELKFYFKLTAFFNIQYIPIGIEGLKTILKALKEV